jgi:hypothetical protein
MPVDMGGLGAALLLEALLAYQALAARAPPPSATTW